MRLPVYPHSCPNAHTDVHKCLLTVFGKYEYVCVLIKYKDINMYISGIYFELLRKVFFI